MVLKKIKKLKLVHYIRFMLYVLLIVFSFKWFPIFPLLLLLAVFIAVIVVLLSNMRLIGRSKGNGIVYGGRRKGKGLLLNHIIKKDKTKPFVNVPYFQTLLYGRYLKRYFKDLDLSNVDNDSQYIFNAKTETFYLYDSNNKKHYYHTELLESIEDYFNSLNPLNVESFITGDYSLIQKNHVYEGRNVYIDDINVYMPNWADSLLKKKYDSMPPFLAINGHIYGAWCVITTQDRERPYKIIKELQGDFNNKAIKTYGFGFFWNCIPLLHFFTYTKYIYHELPKSADMLPFNSKALINETIKHGYLTSGQATKETYEATNGVISYGFVLQLKKNISYDTRIFHRFVYGVKAPVKK